MNFRRRLARLEDRAGSEDCPRCSGVFVVRVNGRIHHAAKNGAPVPADEVREGRCSECGSGPVVIRVSGLGRVSDIGGKR